MLSKKTQEQIVEVARNLLEYGGDMCQHNTCKFCESEWDDTNDTCSDESCIGPWALEIINKAALELLKKETK